MSIHINANKDDFAETVILPGDPLRAKYIAEKYFDDAQQVSDVRNMYGFTGQYKGTRLSVMGSGMGIPSASIYCTELIRDYGVKKIIRAGSCGTVHPDIKLRDLIIAMGASTDSNVNRIRFRGYDLAALADYELLSNAVKAAQDKQVNVRVGNVFTSDLFYTPDAEVFNVMKDYNILGVEMEAAGVYGVAAEYGAQALAMCTVSDHIQRGEALSSEERQSSFDEMLEVALDAAILS